MRGAAPVFAAALLLAAFAGAPATRAEDVAGRWTAASTTATAVTGNVTFAPGRVTFRNGASLVLSPVDPAPAFAVLSGGTSKPGPVSLYRVVKPADPVLLNGNRLCGGAGKPQPVTYLATWLSPMPGGAPWRQVAVFSGGAVPSGEDGACATYGYAPR